jgi:hypothetical protein
MKRTPIKYFHSGGPDVIQVYVSIILHTLEQLQYVADQNRCVSFLDSSLLGGPHAMQEVGGQIPAETCLILGTF